MSTVTVEPHPAVAPPNSPRALAEYVLALPDKGAGLYYPASSNGISLQLGALSILLVLLWAFQAEVVNPGGLPFMLPIALALGGVGIFAGGMWNLRGGITIAGVIGGLYGVFWLSFGLILWLEAGPLTKAIGAADFGHVLGVYLAAWTVISAGLAVATWYVNYSVFAQQLVLTLVFLALAVGYLTAPDGTTMLHVGGWLSLVDAFIAWYVSFALLVNETAGRAVIPVA